MAFPVMAQLPGKGFFIQLYPESGSLRYRNMPVFHLKWFFQVPITQVNLFLA